MIFTDEFLFIHVPKTAGMSLTHALLGSLRGQVYITVPPNHGQRVGNEIELKGTRHEPLPKAAAFLAARQRALDEFATIVAVMRNPYDMEVSRFFYLQKGNSFDRSPAQELAIAGDFTAFAQHSTWWFKDIKDYYTLDGEVPTNLTILRFENLAAEFDAACSPYLQHPTKLPLTNRTEHDDYQRYLTPAAEQAIYEKYRWLFDQGYYARSAATGLSD